MSRVLALDCSSFIGWALFDSRTGVPMFDTWRAPRSYLGDFGRTFVAFEAWLVGMVSTHQPDVIAFEAPITWVVDGSSNHPHSSSDQVRLLVGMATVVELVATRAHRRCIEVPVPEVKKRLTGSGWAKKRDVVNAVVKLGHLVEDDHQADAIGVALVAYDHLGERAP